MRFDTAMNSALGLDRAILIIITDRDLDLHLGYEMYIVLRAPIDLLVATLTTKALGFASGHAMHADTGQGLANRIKTVWLQDRNDHLHRILL